jgi:DNA processing protein
VEQNGVREPRFSSTSEMLGPLNEVERRNAPATLWWAGDVELLRRGRRVSVVGTRHMTDDGRRRTIRLVREMTKRNVIVVSGLAAGIDTAAHRAAISFQGRTIAVIGTGIDIAFPRENHALQSEIARDHLLVSQFPPGHRGAKKTFPKRNRTMVLISDATVIVEAREGGGTLHVGWEALRLGRPLFILRSVVESPLEWPKRMIEYGAMVLSEPDDLFAALRPDDAPVGAVAF